VRLPRRAAAAPLIEHEQRWLPALSRRLPLPVPAPVRLGRPTRDFPWSWSIVRWFEGDSALATPPHVAAAAAAALDSFLAALHHAAPAEPPSTLYGAWRSPRDRSDSTCTFNAWAISSIDARRPLSGSG